MPPIVLGSLVILRAAIPCPACGRMSMLMANVGGRTVCLPCAAPASPTDG